MYINMWGSASDLPMIKFVYPEGIPSKEDISRWCALIAMLGTDVVW